MAGSRVFSFGFGAQLTHELDAEAIHEWRILPLLCLACAHSMEEPMSEQDSSFLYQPGLELALRLLRDPPGAIDPLPESFPVTGLGDLEALRLLAPHVLGRAANLGGPAAFAHMDPPTPWITWATALWNARLNQNLLHRSTAPFAIEAEERVLDWLLPFFGMDGGHMCAGSTLANLTALWAARDGRGVERVVASSAAHLSVEKSARILGLVFEPVATNSQGEMDPAQLGDLSDACLVLTAGTTATGAVDPLETAGMAGWTHIDAAWAGPLRISPRHRHLLANLEAADSVGLSAHKWLFQPKESALILFRDSEEANAVISRGGGYLDRPNVGIQGSRGAAAVSLLATLMAWGREGTANRIDRLMTGAGSLAGALQGRQDVELWGEPKTGIVVFRPRHREVADFADQLPAGMVSTCTIGGESWCRAVAANPLANVGEIVEHVTGALEM